MNIMKILEPALLVCHLAKNALRLPSAQVALKTIIMMVADHVLLV
jgi:hypothetical protein